jgi:hypothetical protein
MSFFHLGQWCTAFLPKGDSDTGYLAKCHNGFLKYIIYTVNVIILRVTKGSMGQLGKGQGPQNAEL